MTRWLIGIALTTFFFGTGTGRLTAQVHVTETIAVDQVRVETAAKLLRSSIGKKNAGVVIYADEKRKELVLTGTVDQVDDMRAMLRRLDMKSDKGKAPDAKDAPRARFHDLSANKADELANRLQIRFNGTEVRVAPVSPNRLLVWARPSEYEQVITEINNFSAK